MQRRKQWTIFDILQYVIMAALLVFMIIMLTAGKSKTVPMDELAAKMEALSSVQEIPKKDADAAAKTFSVDRQSIDEGIYYSSDDVMNVNELLIVRVESDENREKLIDAANAYLAKKTEVFDGYGTNQYGLLTAAVTTEKGEYFFFGVGEDVLQWETTFLKAVR